MSIASRTRRALRIGLGLTILLDAGAGAGQAQEARAPEVVRTWSVAGGAPSRLATSDGRVFVLDRSSATNLSVIDALTAPAGATPATVAVPRRPTDLAYLRIATLDPRTALHHVDERVFVTTTSRAAEVVAVAVQPGEAPRVERTIDLPGTADALCIAALDGLLYVGRRRSRQASLVVLDPSGAIVGSLDLPQSIEELEVADGMVRASGRRSTFAVDVSDPTHPVLASTTARAPAPEPPVPLARTGDFVIDGPLAYLAVKQPGDEVQQVHLHLPLAFPDVDGDGALRLACLGDSNTVPTASLTRWCEKLPVLVDDPRFGVVNLASAGATAIPSSNSAASQVASALEPERRIDAVVLAFGTNDTNLVYFSPDPALFDAQIVAIADAIEVHAAALAAGGLSVYVATAPPRPRSIYGPDGYNERIVALNEEIRARFPARAIIESYDGFHPDSSEIVGGAHLNQRGQDKRAWRAFQVLTR